MAQTLWTHQLQPFPILTVNPMTVCLNVFRGFVPNFANLINSRIQAWTAAAFICILDAFFGVSCIAGDDFYGWLFETVITELSRLWKVFEALSHFSKMVQRYQGFIQAVLLMSVFEKRLSFWKKVTNLILQWKWGSEGLVSFAGGSIAEP